jgi:quercetin dioxygenase-like cupin family protein
MKAEFPTEWVVTGEGVRRRIMVDGEKLMLTEVHFEQGGVGALHSHPHEQATLVVTGRVRFTLAGVEHEYTAGQCIYVPSNLVHGMVALEESLVLDTFSPPREDFRTPGSFPDSHENK